MNEYLTRNQFLKFFRNDDLLNTLTVDDRIEVFSSILTGNSDFTQELFEKLFADYCVDHLMIGEIKHRS